MTHRRARVFGIAVLMLAIAGCGSSSGARRYQNPDMDFGSIRTVAVLPFQNLSRDQLAAERVRDVFANMLLASGAFYVVPHGEVLRVLGRAGVKSPATPSNDEIVKLGTQLAVNAIFIGTVKEYGEVRSGTSMANVVAVSAQMLEVEKGQVVWSAASTKGGVTFAQRLFGSGGKPIDIVTQQAVDDLLDQLFE